MYIFGIHLSIVLYPKSCYNEQPYKEVSVYCFPDTLGKTFSLFNNAIYAKFC